jgi:hypothetical protein
VLALSLPPCRRQPVSALHAADVPVLERRVDAFAGVFQRRGDPAAPPHPRAPAQRLAEHLRRGQPPAHGGRDPAVGIVEAPRGADKVQHGVLHRVPRQLPRRLPLRHQPPPPVNDHAPDRLPPGGVLFGGNADVDARTRLVGELVNLSCRLVTEHGSRPHLQHCSPQSRLPRRDPGESRIDPATQPLPMSRVQPPFDRFVREAGVKRLLSGDDAGLCLKLAKPSQIVRFVHVSSLSRSGARRHHNFPPVDNSKIAIVGQNSRHGGKFGPRQCERLLAQGDMRGLSGFTDRGDRVEWLGGRDRDGVAEV